MTEIFIDSSAFFAWVDSASTDNAAIHHFLVLEHPPLITSNLVVYETVSLITKRIGKHMGIRFGNILADTRIIQTIYADEQVTQKAWQLYRKYTDKDFDLIDAVGFVICKERKIKQVLSLDRHFSQMGFELFPK